MDVGEFYLLLFHRTGQSHKYTELRTMLSIVIPPPPAPRYSWNIAKDGIKHQSIDQTITPPPVLT